MALNGQLLLTTSRRTSADAEAVIKASLIDFPRCSFSVVPKEHNMPEAVGGILGLSDIIVVSSDSISMVSEAVSSGKTVVVFKPQPRMGSQITKHDLFVGRLKDDGYVFVVDPKDIGNFVHRIVKERLTTTPINDQKLLLSAAREII